MNEYQERVIQEFDDLKAKVDKLQDFLFNNVVEAELRAIMVRQAQAMIMYLQCLEERINRF